MESNFRPSQDMLLTDDELRLSAYIFQLKGDPSEELLKIGSTIGTRQHFMTLCPDRVIDKKIIELMAVKLNWNQHNTDAQPAWILPPRFAEAVLKGKMSEDLLPDFAEEWMAAFETLKYIYVPIMEPNGHWYLMVASMDETVIYLVDCHLNSQQTAARKRSIRTIGKVIGRMMFSSYYPHNYLEGNFELGTWDIEEARSCEDHSTSTQQSTICTLEWMQMDDVFMSNLLPRVEDKLVRMKAAMKLLNGPHNENLEMVVEKAQKFWESQMSCE
ncbi:uncharacterized protein LOC130730311 [Lotus japonicus]|nr:uncharacterized protein LOC130730311 [Lotus japonicus]XP_057438264.1 uncharacterized protein LOC130730311 [Lotus japonicus]XP_057438265.1 uncharacterized protein LOC130730311 [Lotus japonicus]